MNQELVTALHHLLEARTRLELAAEQLASATHPTLPTATLADTLHGLNRLIDDAGKRVLQALTGEQP